MNRRERPAEDADPHARREQQADVREVEADRRERAADIREGVLDRWERELEGRGVLLGPRERRVPLGLRRTLLPTSGNGLTPPFSHGYGTGEVAPTQPPTAADEATALPASCLWAHGGMVSTLADMRVWSEALATGALLEPDVWSR